MNGIDAWVDRETKRVARRPNLAEGLLTHRPWRYAFHRTRYLLLRVPLRVLLHLAEVILLGSLFPVEELGPIFAIRALLSIAASLHWGALEALREAVREHARARAWSRATDEIRVWGSRATRLGLTVLALAFSWVWFGPSEFDSFSIFDAYAVAAALRFFVESKARSYAAGIGALQRVPRPIWASVPGDVIDVVGALLVWPWLGPWGFALALLAAGLMRAGLVLHYTRRAYRVSRLRGLLKQRPRRRLPKMAPATKRLARRAAIGNTTSQLDAWILLAFAAAATTEEEGMILAVIHVLRPLLTASAGWSRLFYLDFKRLEFKGRLLQRRLEKFLLRFAVWTAGGTSAVLLSAWPALWGRRPDALALWLVPFLFVRSVLALYQVQAFSYGRFGYLVKTAAAIGVGLAVVVAVPTLRHQALGALTVMLALVVLVARAPRGPARTPHSEVVGLYAWLAAVSAARAPGRVVSAVVHRQLAVRTRRIADEIAAARQATVTIWGSRHIVWFERGSARLLPPGQAVAIASGGGVRSLRVGPLGKDGPAALEGALVAGALEHTLAERLRGPGAVDASRLAADFRVAFPDGIVLDAESGRLEAPPRGDAEPTLSIRGTISDVLHASNGPGSRARSAVGHVFAFAPGGEPELVLVAPLDADAELRRVWRRRVEDATMAASRSVGV